MSPLICYERREGNEPSHIVTTPFMLQYLCLDGEKSDNEVKVKSL